MFENVGSKLKVAAYIYLVIGVVASLFYGIILMSETGLGLVVIILGSFFSWLSSLGIYALGEISDEMKQSNINTYSIYRLLKKDGDEKDESSSANEQ